MSEFEEYAAHGWRLCAIERGEKLPRYKGWNAKPIPDDAVGGLEGAGLLHALSGTCALDIDDIDKARPWLAERGVDLDALLSDPYAVRIDSGRPGRAKLLYAMRRPLRTFKPKTVASNYAARLPLVHLLRMCSRRLFIQSPNIRTYGYIPNLSLETGAVFHQYLRPC